jgi:hypothetical protein
VNLDNNFPAPLQVLMFLGSATLAGILVLVIIYGAIRRRTWVKWPLLGLVIGVVIYMGLLLLFSAVSNEKTLARGQEKYFCEIDCHLAYSVVDVKELGTTNGLQDFVVILRTRFDESTVSAQRPKNAPLMPNPRTVQLVDRRGNTYKAGRPEGVPLGTPLIPGQAYTTMIKFEVPPNAEGLRLLITAPGGPVEFLIGNEMSLGHKKTYMGL